MNEPSRRLTQSCSRGSVAILGAGPAGMATALSVAQAGHDVTVYERYREARPAGNILNLWPPPVKALRSLGVDVTDLGAPTLMEFQNRKGKVRVRPTLDDSVMAEYGGGFIGLLRPQLYNRLLDAIPKGTIRFNQSVEAIEQNERKVILRFSDGSSAQHDVLIGADGIDSLVRRTLWGDVPKREHRLHIYGGYTFDTVPEARRSISVIGHGRRVQGSWTSIRHEGRDGFQWWVLEAWNPASSPPTDLKGAAAALANEFVAPLPDLISATQPGDVQHWVLRDRPPMAQWSKGRATLVGDAAHSTSPYAAYGAGMSIEDAYFLGRSLRRVDLSDSAAVSAALQSFEEPRKPHTARQVNSAYTLGRIFHHLPAPLRPIRDLVFDHTPFLQRVAGDGIMNDIYTQLDLIED